MSGAAIISGIRDAQGRLVETLPIAVRKALLEADTILRLHGMQFELLCEDCHRRYGGPDGANVAAEHDTADRSLSALVCACKRRRFVTL